jgi:hypothetical protein
VTTLQTCQLRPFLAQAVPVRDDIAALASAVQLTNQQLEGYLREMLKTICDDLTTCCGSTPVLDFTELGDVPHSYVGEAGKVVRVNAGETGLEFFTLTLVTTFLGLSDTPGTYAGSGLLFVRVNAGENALEFFDLTATLVTAFTQLSDVPGNYTGDALKVVRVNAGETALEFFTEVFIALGDVPNTYSGAANKVVAVNNAETALIFADQTVTDLSFVHTPRFLTAFLPGVGGTTVLVGGGTLANLGTLTNPAPTNATLITSFYRSHYLSAAGAGNSSAVRTQTLLVTRGSTGVQGGFKLIWTVGTSTALAQQRAFFGLTGATTVIGNVNPSTLTDIVGVGYDSAETVLAFIYNDGSGTATKTPLSASFPVDNSTVYRIEIKCAANASSITITVTNLATGASSSTNVSSNLPTNTVWLAPQAWANNGTTATAVQLDMMAGYLETVL